MITPRQMSAAMGALSNGGRFIPLTLRKGGRPDAAGLRVGGKTGSANKLVNGRYDPTHAVGTFAAVFPADGPLNARRYSILILIDEPGAYPRTGGFVAAPAVGRIADRIAPFLGVQRRADP